MNWYDWKIKKTDLENNESLQDKYSKIADRCNESQEYHIELYIDENDIEWYRTVKNPEPLPPTKEEQEQNRANAYQQEVDTITCNINRLRDEEQTEEVIAEIEQLKLERNVKVAEIKARYPYPVEETNISDGVLSEAKSEVI